MRKMLMMIGVLVALPSICNAGWSGYGQIISVMPFENGYLHIWANMPRHDPNGCGADRYVMPASNLNIKESLAVAITALTTKQQVRFYINDVSCTQGNPTLRAIELRP